MQNNLLKKMATLAVFLALLVVMLGAYTRLTDAGLGCPDWPGCYGKMVLPDSSTGLQAAQALYPQMPIEAKKAWTEMVHRYAAGALALLIFFMVCFVISKTYRGQRLPWKLPMVLGILVIFQALLGMWTVTLKLLPVVVMAHLLGGMALVACLSRFRLQLSRLHGEDLPQWRFWLRLGVVIVFLQIALGGWVTSNYAGIACIGFPRCNGEWLPQLHLAEGFNLFSPLGSNYQGGLLDRDLRVTIQWIHRAGALVTFIYVMALSGVIFFKSRLNTLRIAAIMMALFISIQLVLGIINVIYLLPIESAVAHNGVAALLLATVFSALHFTDRRCVDAY